MKYKKDKELYTIIEIDDKVHELDQTIKSVNYQLAKVILKYLERIND